jgi:predicted HTH transcriptional regulator
LYLQWVRSKENIYPLVNIDFINKETEEQAIITTFKITVYSAARYATHKTNNKLLSDTNYLDNVNETSNICTRFYNVLTGHSYNIELVDMTKENLYAIGVLILVMVSIWSLSIPNNGVSC